MAIVLVLNDDHDMLDTYELMLAELGHTPIAKMTVNSGPETVRDVGADALLVDLMRPDEDAYGLRIIEEIRGDPELGQLPVILCTAGAERVSPLLPRLQELDVPVVLKPFAVSDLEQVLTSVLNTDADAPRPS
jgi:CheY-like chemotaxis protein